MLKFSCFLKKQIHKDAAQKLGWRKKMKFIKSLFFFFYKVNSLALILGSQHAVCDSSVHGSE